ncbi:hypothetical protein WICPIJ_004894 [Wickerhamomyces pijperi]|uniref:Uncharacterized protein n=1 Tax=Wickerhamomyces pijperi TaxID=599730 RepID=A0A9P8Q7A4_WICPI|nr:hypothetical protein WICPIJ_004894 [Wickerhamomyces pijperi]
MLNVNKLIPVTFGEVGSPFVFEEAFNAPFKTFSEILLANSGLLFSWSNILSLFALDFSLLDLSGEKLRDLLFKSLSFVTPHLRRNSLLVKSIFFSKILALSLTDPPSISETELALPGDDLSPFAVAGLPVLFERRENTSI